MKSFSSSVGFNTKKVITKSLVILKIKKYLNEKIPESSKRINFRIIKEGVLTFNCFDQYAAQELRLRETEIKKLSPLIKKLEIKKV